MIRRIARSRIFQFFVLWFVLHTAAILYDGFTDRTEGAEGSTAVVLGNKVEENGLPSERLERRLTRALSLYQNGVVRRIFVSGGKGKEGFDEALIMKQYLVAHDVPEGDIIQDSLGVDTRATARNFAAAVGEKQAVVVSDYFHISRVKLAMRQAGVPTNRSAHAPLKFHIKELYYVPREFFAFYYYLLTPFRA